MLQKEDRPSALEALEYTWLTGNLSQWLGCLKEKEHRGPCPSNIDITTMSVPSSKSLFCCFFFLTLLRKSLYLMILWHHSVSLLYLNCRSRCVRVLCETCMTYPRAYAYAFLLSPLCQHFSLLFGKRCFGSGPR